MPTTSKTSSSKSKTRSTAKWGELVDGVRHYPLHRYQRQFLNSKARMTFAFAGTGGGKTTIMVLAIVKEIEKNDGKGRYLVVSPTYKISKQSGLLDHWRTAVEGTRLQGSYNKTDNIYKCSTGAEIYFRSADTPDSLEGGQYKALFIDEAAKLRYDAWIKAAARVGQEMGPIYGVTTPDMNNWIHSDVMTLATEADIKPDGAIRRSPDGKVLVLQWASTVNPAYSKEELERQRKILPEAVFRRRYLGEFASLEGLVYEKFVESVMEDEPKILPSPAVKVIAGLDWGWNDPCACVVVVEGQDGIAYVVEEMYERQLGLDKLADRLRKLRDKWKINHVYCDHSRPEIQEQMRRNGIPAVAKKVAQIESGIAMVDARLRTGYMKVFPSCMNLIDESQRYQRKSDKDGEFGEKPKDEHNHALDALRYAISGLDFGRHFDFSIDPVKQEEVELEAEIRLGLVSPDPEVREREREMAAEAITMEREAALMWADSD